MGALLGVLGVLGALLGVLALGVGFVGVSGSAVTVGSGPVGSVEPTSTAPSAVVVVVPTVGDSTAEVVPGEVAVHAESVRARTAAVAAEANPAPRLPPLRTTALTCICLP
ncbi:hypothetical protein GCM10009868_35130 [Terrabacter aerolatus]|uniref:Uncharacterized protein n=1 Tax=Terrabacter aerolatus TaxID=422442 RepID=A0A512CWA3_9MICO|nr:hypothetical protein TAE01_03120 [Terrabacter aerolatus]